MTASKYGERGAFMWRTTHVFGHWREFKICVCERCKTARELLPEAKRLVRAARLQLRAHGRRSRSRLRAQPTADERLRRKIEAARAVIGCSRCGGRLHDSCGVAVVNGRPDPTAHGRRVRAGKLAAAKACARAAAAVQAEAAATFAGASPIAGEVKPPMPESTA